VRSPGRGIPNPQNVSITLFITGVFEEDWRAKVTKRYNLVQAKICLDSYLDIYRSSHRLLVIPVMLSFGYRMEFNNCRPRTWNDCDLDAVCHLTKFTLRRVWREHPIHLKIHLGYGPEQKQSLAHFFSDRSMPIPSHEHKRPQSILPKNRYHT